MNNIPGIINQKRLDFYRTAKGTDEQKKKFFQSLNAGKCASVALWILQITTIKPSKYQNWQVVDLQELYEDISQLAASINTTSFPKKANFNGLNNLVNQLRNGKDPFITGTTKRSFNELIWSDEYQELIKFFWLLKVDGYFSSDVKNKAHIAEQQSRNQSNVYGVNDGGVDHTITFNGEIYATDYKDFVVDLNTVKSLITHRPSSFFCIRSKGFKDLFNQMGQLSDEFQTYLISNKIKCSVIVEEHQSQLFIKQQ